MLTAAAGAEVAGGGPLDPLADGAAAFSGRAGANLVKAGTAVGGAGALFLANHGQVRDAANAVIEGVADVVNKFTPDYVKPFLDASILDPALNAAENAAGIKNMCRTH